MDLSQTSLYQKWVDCISVIGAFSRRQFYLVTLLIIFLFIMKGYLLIFISRSFSASEIVIDWSDRSFPVYEI